MQKYDLETLDNLLYKVRQPYQYIGQEMLSANKDIEKTSVNFAFCFPDKYEIGSCNLGVRVLYEVINKIPDFYCDRAYAPDFDFAEQLQKNDMLLYCVESKVPLKYFDFVGFSLQYELAYPTMLKMLELGGISVLAKDRKEDEPIIVAGGPCAYNPLPVEDFVDLFTIGDGEEVNIEIMQKYKELTLRGASREDIIKEISTIDGVYSPKYSKKVTKRVFQLKKDAQPTHFFIPYSSSVHDRATVEIRRGCGRMCRFCQAGHVNLPIRELEPQDVIDNTLELLSCTGFDEYSLLSLSSNDYPAITSTIKKLSSVLTDKKVSASLPSQRLDKFSVELADLIHQVRKTTVTLAPEAGSQRLRNVINKNISKEQIFDTILTCYKNGYSSFKLYFMLGLPTETKEDLDEFAQLFKELFYKAKLLRKELNIKDNLRLTASMSIFVPKPFTPFQWCAQDDIETIKDKIKYVKDITYPIKGLSVKIHDYKISQLEAAFARGDKRYNKFIYELYKNGVYLATWGENFNFALWLETAKKCGIDISSDATKKYDLEEKLCWDFINIGVTKEWFKQQYNNALSETPIIPCEFKCSDCGVCKKFPKTRKLIKDYLKADCKIKDKQIEQTTNYKYRLRITKPKELKYLSHLDWQNTMIKALYRSNLPVAFSQGFNPTPKLSLGIALPVFVYSQGELIDLELTEKLDEKILQENLQKVLPDKIIIKEVKLLTPPYSSIESTVEWADYKFSETKNNFKKSIPFFEKMEYIRNIINSSDDLFIEKKNKKGITNKINVKNSIAKFEEYDDSFVLRLKTGQQGEIPTLRPDILIKTIFNNEDFNIERLNFYDINEEKV